MKYIAFLDILGFSKFVEANDLNTIVESYAPLLTGIHFSVAGGSHDRPQLDYQVHSDTICILTRDDSLASLSELLRVCHMALFSYFYHLQGQLPRRLPIRGAIAKGEMVFGDYQFSTQAINRPKVTTIPIHTLIGKPVIQASQWEKKQEWMGVSFCPELYEEVVATPTFLAPLLDSHLIVPYEVPIKSEKTVMSFAINPIQTYLLDRILPPLRSEHERGAMHPKLERTLAFIEHINRTNLCYPARF